MLLSHQTELLVAAALPASRVAGNARAYDAVIVAASVLRQYGISLAAVHDGLGKIENIPSVEFGSVRFDRDTRRVKNPSVIDLVVHNGALTLWEGATPQAG